MKKSDLSRLKTEVAEQLRDMDISYSPSEGRGMRRSYGPYHKAAAVLSTFDVETLRPVGAIEPEESVEDLLADSTLLRGPGKGSRWALVPNVRRDILQRMGSREELQRALSANPDRPRDITQEMLEAYIEGVAPALSRQTADEVAGTFQVAQWLEGVVEGVPDRDSIQRRHAWLNLLQPFETLAGTHFRGREEELKKLSRYVGVSTGFVRAGFMRIAPHAFEELEKPPLVIYGPGGVGKSALVARLILTYAAESNSQQLPWTYIDFDRPGMLAEEPLTLLVEAVRQLGIQYPDARKYCDRIREDWQRHLARPTRQASLNLATASIDIPAVIMRSSPQHWDRFLRDFAILLNRLKAQEAPFLLVLDTFEEVQYRSPVVVAALAEFLAAFQRYVPRLRTVFAGRESVTGIPGFPTQELPLEDFDAEAAQAFLEARGVSPSATAKLLARQVGGNPLSLTLAQAVWRLDERRSNGIKGLRTYDLRRLRRVQENQIQGQLFTRILRHIHDEDVRKLAYPGLVLRRISPELILEVLAEPCGVDVKDSNDAQRLFDEMTREVALVRVEDGMLRHRPDIRRIMIDLLREAEPDKIRQIEEAAVAYYQGMESDVDRAEEIYHRLSLKQPLSLIEERWTDGVRTYLYSALDELSISERAWLAPRLGLTLTTEERKQAAIEAWERDTAQRVRRLLQHDLVPPALTALRERTERLPGSPLYLLEAQVLELQENWQEALRVIEDGIVTADESGTMELAIDLRIRGATEDIRLGNLEAAERKLEEAESDIPSYGNYPLRSLEISLVRLRLERAKANNAGAIPSLQVRLRDQLGQVSDEQIIAQPVLIGWVAGELRGEYPDVIERIVRLSGIETERSYPLIKLGHALAAWDEQLSKAANQAPGIVGRSVPLLRSGTLIEVWTKFVLYTYPGRLSEIIVYLLDTFEPVHQDVWDAIADVLRERAQRLAALQDPLRALPSGAGLSRLQPFASLSIETSKRYRPTQIQLSPQQVSQLCNALKEAFPTRQALAQMVKFRLDRNLDVISLSDDLATSVATLIQAAHVGGWSAQLLVAAREARPESAELLTFSEQYGLAPTLSPPQELALSLREAGSSLDERQWKARLGRLETQLCRIEVSEPGKPILGSGFLIGPSLLLTTYSVVEALRNRSVDPRSVVLRFDYKRMANGSEISQGTEYRLGSDWLVAGPDNSVYDANSMGSATNDLNFALLRIAGWPGTEPIGGNLSEPNFAPRGWMEFQARSADLQTGAPFVVLYYAKDGRLRLSLKAPGIVSSSVNGTELEYENRFYEDLPGSPCFTIDLVPIAIHQRSSHSGGEGVPLSAVLGRFQVSESGQLPGSSSAGSAYYVA